MQQSIPRDRRPDNFMSWHDKDHADKERAKQMSEWELLMIFFFLFLFFCKDYFNYI